MIAAFKVVVLIVIIGQSIGFFQRQLQTTESMIYGKSQEPTNAYKMKASNCSYKVVHGFLKEKCLINNRWYFKCSRSYRFYTVEKSTCTESRFSRVCPNDTTFYQACGHMHCNRDSMERPEKRVSLHKSFGPDVAACGYLICQWSMPDENLLFGNFLRSGETISSSGFDCSHMHDDTCMNTINGMPVHKYVCDRSINEQSNESTSQLSTLKNFGRFHEKVLCDNFCDVKHGSCEDEAFCNNMTIGIYCKKVLWREEMKYVPPYQICDGNPNCYSNIDEAGCKNFQETCWTENYHLVQASGKLTSKVRRFLSPRAKCSVPAKRLQFLVCTDYRDQMNCTGSTISSLLCNVDGFPTTISEHVICRDKSLGLCDDKIDNQCVEAETGCKVHKHKLCDGIKDCQMGYDEGDSFCKDVTESSDQAMRCVRKFSRDSLERKLPNRWVLDGISDCRSDTDENPQYWTKLCGYGKLNVYVFKSNKSKSCSGVTQLKCPLSSKLLNLERVCSANAMDNCDAQVCTTARKEFRVDINDKLKDMRSKSGAKRTIYCLPGLHEIEMYAGNCKEIGFLEGREVLGVSDIIVLSSKTFAGSHIECSEIFGELYVYLACSGLCDKSIKSGDHCPLNFTLGSWTCLNYPAAKTVLSLADDGQLALAIVKRNKTFSQEIFSCKNGRCTTFDKVCNLVDDCGDLSDEKRCFNNFKCNMSGEYIPLTSKCDGKFDCFDYSDECNNECNNQVTMFDHTSYKVIAWIFGVSATVLNAITLFHGLVESRKLKTETAMVNKVFVLLITSGDLLQGIFLLVLSIGEQFFNKSTCVTQFEWTTSGLCTFLGVLSTIGSLVSLYSMTILSIIRASKVNSMIRPKETLSTKRSALLSLVVLTIVIISACISILPIISYEDYFVENLIYDENPLLVGAPDKTKHLRIAESYFGRIREGISKTDVSWRQIQNLIKELFANNEVKGRSIDFYGSNGFCLFSYFVRKETKFRWYSISILTLNFICVLAIVVCYVIITVVSLKSSESICKNSQTEKNNKKLQRKITIIIMTDILTWLPFIIVCSVNYTALVDTSSWYSIFCVFFLRINSIINPIGIYDELVFKWIKTLALKSRIEGAWSYVKSLFDHTQVANQIVQTMEMVEINQIVKTMDMVEIKPERVANQNEQITEMVEVQPEQVANQNEQITEMVEVQPEQVANQNEQITEMVEVQPEQVANQNEQITEMVEVQPEQVANQNEQITEMVEVQPEQVANQNEQITEMVEVQPEQVANQNEQITEMIEVQPEQVANQNEQITEMVEVQPEQVANQNEQITEMVEVQPEQVANQNEQITEMAEVQPEQVANQNVHTIKLVELNSKACKSNSD